MTNPARTEISIARDRTAGPDDGSDADIRAGIGVGIGVGAQANARRTGLLLVVVLSAQLMSVLDLNIVNVALPTIRATMRTSAGVLQLIVAGYVIAYAVLLVTGARLGDRYGQPRLFRIGMAVFTVASLACGLAWAAGPLIGFRFAQGIGAALMVPQVMTLIQRAFPSGQRARALGLWAAVIAAGTVVGQVAGGVLVSADLFGAGWRSVFLVNVPIGLAVLVLGRRILPSNERNPGRSLDIPGLVVFSLAVLLLVVPLVLGREQGWPPYVWLALGASAVLFGCFVVVERKASAPLFPGPVLRAPGMLPAALALLLTMTAIGGFMFSLSVHLQGGLGHSALGAGLLFLPAGAGIAVAGLNHRRLPERWRKPTMPLGSAAMMLSAVALGVLLWGGADIGVPALVLFTVNGLGAGVAFSPLMNHALTYVPTRLAADASGLLTTTVQLGQVTGVATIGTLFLSRVQGPGATGSGTAVGWALVACGAASLLALVAVVRSLRTGTRSAADQGSRPE